MLTRIISKEKLLHFLSYLYYLRVYMEYIYIYQYCYRKYSDTIWFIVLWGNYMCYAVGSIFFQNSFCFCIIYITANDMETHDSSSSD